MCWLSASSSEPCLNQRTPVRLLVAVPDVAGEAESPDRPAHRTSHNAIPLSECQPRVPTRGSIALELTMQNADGKVLYHRSFSGSGNSYCLTGDCAFGAATKEALTEVLNKIVAACSSEEFRHALKT
jgi:hypothetical protein